MPPLSGILRTILAAMLALAPALAPAQTFDSGSDGSYGPIDIAADTTLDLPPDGVIHATTVNVPFGATLRFNRNATNTPVVILATGDVLIAGAIDVSATGSGAGSNGLGGAGGFDGGPPANGVLGPGHGKGPGGGAPGADDTSDAGAGQGAYGGAGSVAGPNSGATYGNNLIAPLIGGSGGGGTPTVGGGGGGGAILIASNTLIDLAVFGGIRALGGGSPFSGAANEGSGGAIRLVAPIVRGGGSTALDVQGGLDAAGTTRGGHGRIRVDTLDSTGFATVPRPTNAASTGALMTARFTLPTLSIVSAAGTAIAEGATSNALIVLPPGSSASQPVTVRARGFGTNVPIRITITPDNGPQATVDGTIDNSTSNPAEATLQVALPTDVPVHIAVSSR